MKNYMNSSVNNYNSIRLYYTMNYDFPDNINRNPGISDLKIQREYWNYSIFIQRVDLFDC